MAGQEDRKFFAADAPGDARLGKVLHQQRAELSQDLITGLVTVAIVDLFEQIDVSGHQHTDAIALLTRLAKGVFHGVVKPPVIEQTGQSIDFRQFPESGADRRGSAQASRPAESRPRSEP